MEYKTKQIGWMIIILTVGVLLGIFLFLPKLMAMDPNAGVAFYSTSGVFFFVLLLFYQMETSIDEKVIEIKFGIGLIKKTIPIADIESVTAVKNSWWFGWGIRLTPYGWLWNISGYDAVELLKKSDGKKFRIGCKDSAELESEIKKRL
jgi:hypothetical protein